MLPHADPNMARPVVLCLVYNIILLINYSPQYVMGISDQDKLRVDQFIEQVMECTGIPGLTLAAVHGGTQEIVKGYGLANIDTGEPVTETTLFGIGSLTKAFTSLLLGQLLFEHPQ